MIPDRNGGLWAKRLSSNRPTLAMVLIENKFRPRPKLTLAVKVLTGFLWKKKRR